MNNNPVVQTLIGKNQLKFYLCCLKSLVTFCQDRIKLQLHTDGSLSQKDKDFIHSELNGTTITITDSSENSNRVLDYLQGRPNCQKFRKDSLWGVEFFDPLFSNLADDISFYIDADILFIRPFAGLFDGSQVSKGAIFIRDKQWDAYCLRPWQLLGGNDSPKIAKGITTALVFWDKTAIDWDYLEWFLGQMNLHKIPDWIMPTAQAGLATRCKAKTVHPFQLLNMYPNSKIQHDTFGLHLLGSYRTDWLSKLKDINFPVNEDSIQAKFKNCQRQNFLNYSIKHTRRWVNTRLNCWI